MKTKTKQEIWVGVAVNLVAYSIFGNNWRVFPFVVGVLMLVVFFKNLIVYK